MDSQGNCLVVFGRASEPSLRKGSRQDRLTFLALEKNYHLGITGKGCVEREKSCFARRLYGCALLWRGKKGVGDSVVIQGFSSSAEGTAELLAYKR